MNNIDEIISLSSEHTLDVDESNYSDSDTSHHK